MRLAKLSEFRRLIYTPESAPSERTLRARIHEIPGGTVEFGHYYVDLDEYARAMRMRDTLTGRLSELARDPLLADLT